jgi:predicted transcriptional regulator
MIRRGSDGFFETTSLGKTILELLPGIQFLSKNANYVLSHDFTKIPTSFVARIGELLEGKLVGHFNIVLERIKTTILEAKEYLWLIADQPIIPTTSVGIGFPSRALPVKLIIQPGYDLKTFSQARSSLPTKFEIGMVNEVRIAMAMNEKDAGVCFPGLDGKIDFGVGFIGSDPSFRGWCRDLFDHYWKSAQQVRF